MMGNALRMQLIRKRRKSEIGKLILSRKLSSLSSRTIPFPLFSPMPIPVFSSDDFELPVTNRGNARIRSHQRSSRLTPALFRLLISATCIRRGLANALRIGIAESIDGCSLSASTPG